MKDWLGRLKALWARLIQRRIPGNKALIVVGVALAFFIQLYNCFGMATGAEEGNTRFVQTFLAPWMPRNPAPRDMITVVVYDKASFDALDIDVPILPYARQAELLYKVAASHPASIFIDANYRRDLSDPEGLADFHSAIDRVRSGTAAPGVPAIPVYIGEVKPRRPSNPAFASADDFFGTAAPVKTARDKALDVFQAFHDDARKHDYETGTLFIPDHSFDYPAETVRQFPAPEKTIVTPAFRVYRDFCTPANLVRLPATIAGQLRCGAADLRALEQPDVPPMAVQWLSYNSGSDRENAENSNCRGQARSHALTLLSDIARNIYRKPARNSGYVYNPCLYLRSVTLTRVLAVPANDKGLSRDLSGKAVMIGSALGDDSIIAPDQGKVPGVMLHAMALENLLSYGADYHRWPQEIRMFGGSISVDFFIDLLLVFIASRVASDIETRFARHEESETPHREGSHRRELLVYFVTAVTVAIALSGAALIVTYSWLHWTPINAQAITLSALAVAGIEKYRELLIEATRWSLAGIAAFLITAGLVSWFALSLFVTNDIFDRTLTDRSLILWSGVALATWTVLLMYGYRAGFGRAWRAGRRYARVISRKTRDTGEPE